MDIKKFIEHFCEAAEIENTSIISTKTKFRDLEEWNSLSSLGIIALADEEYGVELNPDVFRKAQTIEDLFNAIQALK